MAMSGVKFPPISSTSKVREDSSPAKFLIPPISEMQGPKFLEISRKRLAASETKDLVAALGSAQMMYLFDSISPAPDDNYMSLVWRHIHSPFVEISSEALVLLIRIIKNYDTFYGPSIESGLIDLIIGKLSVPNLLHALPDLIILHPEVAEAIVEMGAIETLNGVIFSTDAPIDTQPNTQCDAIIVLSSFAFSGSAAVVSYVSENFSRLSGLSERNPSILSSLLELFVHCVPPIASILKNSGFIQSILEGLSNLDIPSQRQCLILLSKLSIESPHYLIEINAFSSLHTILSLQYEGLGSDIHTLCLSLLTDLVNFNKEAAQIIVSSNIREDICAFLVEGNVAEKIFTLLLLVAMLKKRMFPDVYSFLSSVHVFDSLLEVLMLGNQEYSEECLGIFDECLNEFAISKDSGNLGKQVEQIAHSVDLSNIIDEFMAEDRTRCQELASHINETISKL